jgi:hypothetical protein
VGVLVTCVLVFTVFYILCTVFFVLLPPSDNSIALSSNNNNNNNNNNRIGMMLKQQVYCFRRNTELVILRARAIHQTPVVRSCKG